MYLQTLKDMTYSLNFISVLLCTHSVYFVLAVVLGFVLAVVLGVVLAVVLGVVLAVVLGVVLAVVLGVVLAVVLGVASLADFHSTTCSLFPKSTISFNRT